MAWHPFRNIGLKLLSVGLATLLWVTVTRDQQAERNLLVPLEFQNIPAELEITSETPATVDVRVRGASSALGRLQPGDVVAVLDLTEARQGPRIFHLMANEVRLPFGLEVAQINPPTVKLTFELTNVREFPITAKTDDALVDGFVKGTVTVTPAKVEVTGPNSHLSKGVEVATELVSVAGKTATFTDTVAIGVNDSLLRLPSQRTARVTVEILPAPIERSFAEIPVDVRNLPGRLQASVDPAQVAATVRGSREAVAAVDAKGLQAWVDGASLSAGRYELPVQFDSIPGCTVGRVEPAKVQVRLR